jgi:diguanylate cyclase (GGDEF)-like protein
MSHSSIQANLVTSLVCVGIGLLGASLIPVCGILRLVRAGSLREGWSGLAALILLFIPGYATFAWSNRDAQPTNVTLNVALVMFLGSFFVVVVTFLSRHTVRDLLRAAMLARDAIVDPLTGVFNRRYLETRLNGEVRRAFRYKRPLSVLMLDLDHFKEINDQFGHQGGDVVLSRIGTILATESRGGDIVTRYGGDEFLIVAPDTDPDAAMVLAERLRHKIENSKLTNGTGAPISVTVTIGLSSLLSIEDAAAMIEMADRALYDAKLSGRNCVRSASQIASGPASMVRPVVLLS